MILALVIFAVTYLLMLALPKERPWVALCSAAVFMALGQLGVYDFSLSAALGAVDYNVLLMMSGTMGIVSLFIRSRMPARLAEQLIVRVPNAQWAVCVLALFAGVISAFVDNVATVLMVAPVGLAIARKLKISPVPVIIAIAVSSNLQGAATLVGDTTSILLGGFAEMNFFDFFWMHGRPGIFWGVELGALTSLLVLLWLFRKEKQSITASVETQVEDDVPTALMLLTVGLLIVASFLPQPESGLLATLYDLRSGLICMTLCVVGTLGKAAGAGGAGAGPGHLAAALRAVHRDRGHPHGGCHRRCRAAVPYRGRGGSFPAVCAAGGGIGGAVGFH